jgi:membrane protease YdiL (CAAX protease family)
VRQWLRSLPLASEVTLVLLVAFGLSIPVSLAALFGGLPSEAGAPITNQALLTLALYEFVILVVLTAFLRLRGWTLERLGLWPTVRDSLVGCALAVVAYLGYALLEFAAGSLWPQLAQAAKASHLVGADLSWGSVLLVSAVNPLFEELFLCGYVIAALRERIGVTAAINVSVGVRVFCHFYQGALGVLGIVPVALLFAYWYARSGRLWSLIVAHAILDVTALMLDR